LASDPVAPRDGQAARLLALHELTLEISAGKSVPDLLTRIVAAATRLCNASSGTLYLWDNGAGVLRARVNRDVPDGAVIPSMRPGEGLAGAVWQRNAPVIVNDYAHWDGAMASGIARGLRAGVGVPLPGSQASLGVLLVRRYETGAPYPPFTDEESTLLTLLAGQTMHLIERARMEEELRAAYQFRDEVIANASQGVVVYDRDLRYRVWNPFMERITGMPAADVLGTAALTTFPHLIENGIDVQLRLVLQGETVCVPDQPYQVRQTGRSDWTSAVYSPHRDVDGKVIGVIGVISDVTTRRQIEEDRRRSEQRYRNLFEQSNDAVIIHDLTGRILEVNDRTCELLGLPRQRLCCVTVHEIWSAGTPQAINQHFAYVAQHGSRRLESRVKGPNGTIVDVDVSSRLLNGDPPLVQALLRDITARKQAERLLRESADRFESLVQNASDIIAVLDADGTLRYLSRSTERVLGTPPGDFTGQNLARLVHPQDAALVARYFATAGVTPGVSAAMEMRLRHAGGSWRCFEAIASNLLDDANVNGIVVNARDITERKELEEQLRQQASHDALTGLPNRTLFADRLQQTLNGARRRDSMVAVLFLDLDGFKLVNDGYGHGAGDDLLILVGQRIQSCLRVTDTVARFGGDEFAVLLPDVASPRQAVRLAGRITRQLHIPFPVAGQELCVTASIGITYAPAAGRQSSPEELMRQADVAMYRAKAAGKARAILYDTVQELPHC